MARDDSFLMLYDAMHHWNPPQPSLGSWLWRLSDETFFLGVMELEGCYLGFGVGLRGYGIGSWT